MARRPVELQDSRVTHCILKAMRRLHQDGYQLLGPTQIGKEAAVEYGKSMASTLVSMYLRRLAETGEVERHSQGVRRGIYRLVQREF